MVPRRRIVWVTVLVLAALLVGAGAYWFWGGRTSVAVTRVKARDVTEVVIATGRLRSQTESALGVDVGGIVDKVNVEEGDRVKAGEVLVTLRTQTLQSKVEQAQAQLQAARHQLEQLHQGPTTAEANAARAEVARTQAAVAQAEQDFQRAQKLVSAGVETRANLDQAKTKLGQARAELRAAQAKRAQLQPRSTALQQASARVDEAAANLKVARTQLDNATVAAPFAGLVVRVQAKPGQSVSPGQSLLTLASMDDAEYYVETDEDNLDRLKVGQPAVVFFPSRPNEHFQGTVRQIGPEIDTERGVVGVHVKPKSLPKDAFPGLTVDVNIEVANFKDTLAVPVTSVLRDGKQAYVLVVDDGRAQRQKVEVLASGQNFAAVRGLDKGTRVVENAASVEAGARVDAEPGAAPPARREASP